MSGEFHGDPSFWDRALNGNVSKVLQDTVRTTLATLPYARMLGVEPRFESGNFMLVMPYKADLIGNPVLPALHGGAVGGFLELCAIIQTMLALREAGRDEVAQPKPIGISMDYLRRGRPEDSFARAEIVRLGSRVANVRATAWQSDPNAPTATLHGHFLLPSK